MGAIIRTFRDREDGVKYKIYCGWLKPKTKGLKVADRGMGEVKGKSRIKYEILKVQLIAFLIKSGQEIGSWVSSVRCLRMLGIVWDTLVKGLLR